MLMNRERGTAAILVASSLILLMGMAAIAVDYGAGLNERRQDQTGADLSVLSGALELALGSSTQTAVDEILELVDSNVATAPPSDWVSCTDDDALPVTAADLGLTPATECISFNTFSHIRVRVPDQDTGTTFARLLGVLTLTTSAAAESNGQLFPTEGNPPPFAVLAGSTGGDVVCLRTGSSGNPPARMEGNGPGNPASRGTEPDPCDDSEYDVDSEMFGLLDPYSYFDGNGEISCKKNSNDYFIAASIDHSLSSFIQRFGAPYSGTNEIEDGDGCSGTPKNPVNGANTIPVKSGLTASELRCGLITARSGTCASVVPGPPASGLSSPARLHQGDHVQSSYTFLGESMDNAAPWDFFTTDTNGDVAFTDAPASCDAFATAINSGLAGWDYYDQRDALVACLIDWTSGNHDPIFTAEVWTSSRFAFVPLLHEATLDNSDPNGPTTCPVSNDPNCVHIDDFVPVWLQTLYTQAPDASCDDQVNSGPNKWGMHHAGQSNSCGSSNGNVDRLSAIVLDCGMIPDDVCQSRPGPPSPGGDLVPTIRLTK